MTPGADGSLFSLGMDRRHCLSDNASPSLVLSTLKAQATFKQIIQDIYEKDVDKTKNGLNGYSY